MSMIKTGNDVILGNVFIKYPELTTIGNHVAIDNGFYCTTELVIGDYVHIGPNVTVIGSKNSKLVLEEFSGISAGSTIICGSEDVDGTGLFGPVPVEFQNEKIYSTVTFKRFSGCFAHSIVMPTVTLAEGSLLLVNSFLTKDTVEWTFYLGNPAKKLRRRKQVHQYEYAKKLGY